MSQGNSIFSSPNGSNGEAPANPFASLGANSQKPSAASSSAASPFAAVSPPETESPFGFAAEEPASEQLPQAKIPEKRAQAPLPSKEDNPFLSSAASPPAEAPSKPAAPSPAPAPASSPFSAEGGFEAPASNKSVPTPPSGDNPLASFAAEAAKAPVPEFAPEATPRPAQPAQAQPQPTAPEPASASFSNQSAPAPAPASTSGYSTRQLELRAIFGSEGEMTRDEILTRAKGLPGIREVTVVGPSEASATKALEEVMTRFGFGGEDSWQLTCAGGVVDFVSAEGTTLAVLREGRYSGGVWETLMIVARELGKLS